MTIGAVLTLVLQARENTLRALQDSADDRTEAKAAMAAAFETANRRLAADTLEVLRWSFIELATIMADLGIREHNRAFQPAIRLIGQGYGDQTAEDVARAFDQRRRYLPDLTATVWGRAERRERMLANLLDVVDADDRMGAMDMAGVLERMWAPARQGPRWAWSRMQILSPRGRARSRLGLLPPGSVRGESYVHLRLARTEIAGLQQRMAADRYAVQPWVTGVEWTLSPAHPRLDICDDLADRNPYPKDAVPPIPHPNCLCVLVPAVMEPSRFAARTEAWARGENEFLDDYADWLGDRSFLESYPMVEGGGLRTWTGKDLPEVPNDLRAIYETTRWSPRIRVSTEAAEAWDRVKGSLSASRGSVPPPAAPPPTPVPVVKALHEMNADEAVAYLRNPVAGSQAARKIRKLRHEIKSLEARAKRLDDEIVDTLKYKGDQSPPVSDRKASAAPLIEQRDSMHVDIIRKGYDIRAAMGDLREEIMAPEPLSNMQVVHELPKSWTAAEKRLARRKTDRGVRDFQRMVRMPEGDDRPHFYANVSKTQKRANHSPEVGMKDSSLHISTINVNLDDPLSTHIHEWGHALEWQDRARFERSVDFLQRRTQTDSARRMRDLTGNPNYDAHEIAIRDDFADAYTGKIYRGGSADVPFRYRVSEELKEEFPDAPDFVETFVRSSEVASMGIQRMWENALGLLESDEDMFRFVWQVLMER